MLENSISYRISAPDAILTDCYADTAVIGFQVMNNTRLIGCTYLASKRAFPLESITVIDHVSGKLTASSCYFREFAYDKDICNIYRGSGENFYAEDMVTDSCDGWKDSEEFKKLVKQ